VEEGGSSTTTAAPGCVRNLKIPISLVQVGQYAAQKRKSGDEHKIVAAYARFHCSLLRSLLDTDDFFLALEKKFLEVFSSETRLRLAFGPPTSRPLTGCVWVTFCPLVVPVVECEYRSTRNGRSKGSWFPFPWEKPKHTPHYHHHYRIATYHMD
jgi:hypothetical protein